MDLLRLFRRSPRVIHSQKAALDREEAMRMAQESWAKLLKRVSELELAVRNLDEHHSTTVSQLTKLRGQVHGHRAQSRGGEEGGGIPFGDKDALRRRAGITHNTRFIHPEEK